MEAPAAELLVKTVVCFSFLAQSREDINCYNITTKNEDFKRFSLGLAPPAPSAKYMGLDKCGQTGRGKEKCISGKIKSSFSLLFPCTIPRLLPALEFIIGDQATAAARAQQRTYFPPLPLQWSPSWDANTLVFLRPTRNLTLYVLRLPQPHKHGSIISNMTLDTYIHVPLPVTSFIIPWFPGK